MKKILIAVFVLMMAACAEKKGETGTTGTGGNETPANNNPGEVITNDAAPGNTDGATNPDKAPALTFEQKHVNLGTITEGESVEIVYSFTNTGTAPLVLSAVEPTCGCTVPDDWPKDPIAPGSKGKIKAKYNSEGRGTGSISKKIVVKSNVPYPNDITELEFTVQVNPKN